MEAKRGLRFRAACIGLLSLAPVLAQDVRGRVVGPDGKPAARARIARTWSFPDPASADATSQPSCGYDSAPMMVSDERGEFTGSSLDERTLFALDSAGKLGALIRVEQQEAAAALDVKLAPLVEVGGRFDVRTPGEPPKKTAFWVAANPMQGGFVASCISESKTFRVWLPPGEYTTWYSTDAVNLYSMSQLQQEPLVIAAGQGPVDLGALELDLPLVLHPQGVVLDADGQPVSDATIGRGWRGLQGRMVAHDGFQGDAAGRFRGDVEVYDSARPMVLVAFDKKCERAAIAPWDPAKPDEPVEFRLQPTIRVHGRFLTAETKQVPYWTNVYLSLPAPEPREGEPAARDHRIAECQSFEATFDLRLPPGKYRFQGYGTDTLSAKRELELSPDRPELDLGVVELPQTVIARNVGKDALPWKITEARGLAREAKLADFRGKWVLIEFWGHW